MCIVVYYSRCVAVCCSVSQFDTYVSFLESWVTSVWVLHGCKGVDLLPANTCIKFSWCVAGCCNTLQHTATHCNTLQHTASHCNILHHTATNQLQYTATHTSSGPLLGNEGTKLITKLQHIATHTLWNTLQQTYVQGFCPETEQDRTSRNYTHYLA